MTGVTFNPEVNAVYVQVATTQIVDSQEVAPNIILDLDAENRVVGIKVLHVSRTPSPGA